MKRETQKEGAELVLVTGLSGAGRSTTLKILEDLGFEAVDNIPLSLLPRLAAGVFQGQQGDITTEWPMGLAVGVDSRTRDFSVDTLLREAARLRDQSDLNIRILYLDCDDEVLVRRFAETRRRHPLALDRPVADGLTLERGLLGPLRAAADLVFDTSDSNIWQLKHRISGAFARAQASEMTISVWSFSYRQGVPRDADLVFDVRFLRNPHYDDALRDFTGRDASVSAYIAEDKDYAAYWSGLTSILSLTLPRYRDEGKSYLTIGFGCTGGKHRSVHFAEKLSEWLRDLDWSVTVSHRDAPRGLDMTTK